MMDALSEAKRIVADAMVAEQNRDVSLFRRCRIANSSIAVYRLGGRFKVYCALCGVTTNETHSLYDAEEYARDHKLLHIARPK